MENVTLFDYQTEWDAATERAAFSNGYEWDCWSSVHCVKCVNDENDDCQLVLVGFMGRTPVQWVEEVPFGLYDRYRCTEFTPVKATIEP